MPTEDRSITKVKSQIDYWRANKPSAKSHMPKTLWVAAALLAKQHGVRLIAQKLALHPTRLRMHAGNASAQAGRKTLSTGRKGESERGEQVKMIEVAPIHISAEALLRGAQLSKNPTAVLSTPQGVSLSFYQELDVQSIVALARATVEVV